MIAASFIDQPDVSFESSLTSFFVLIGADVDPEITENSPYESFPMARLARGSPNENASATTRADQRARASGRAEQLPSNPRSDCTPNVCGPGGLGSTLPPLAGQLYGRNESSEAKRLKELQKHGEYSAQTIDWQRRARQRPCSRSLPRKTSKPPERRRRAVVVSAGSISGFRSGGACRLDRQNRTTTPTSTRCDFFERQSFAEHPGVGHVAMCAGGRRFGLSRLLLEAGA